MRLEYQLTLDDYRDAQKLLAQNSRGEKPSAWERWQFALLAVGIVIGCFVATFVDAMLHRSASGQTPEPTAIGQVVIAALGAVPWLLVLALTWPIFCGMYPAPERRSLRNMYLVGVVLIAGSSIASSLMSPPSPPSGEPFAWKPFLLSNLTFWLTLLLYAVVMIRYVKGAVVRAWTGQEHLHTQRVMEVDERSVRWSDIHSQTEYFWAAFPVFRESDRQFLLHVGRLAFHSVPKRAFASGEQIEQFRALLETKIGSQAPRGFTLGVPPSLPGKLP